MPQNPRLSKFDKGRSLSDEASWSLGRRGKVGPVPRVDLPYDGASDLWDGTIMIRQPVLKGELLELRPLRPEDFDDLYAVAADPLIWDQHPHNTRYQEEVFRKFFQDALASGGALIAIDSETGRVVGSSRYDGYNQEKSQVEIGWTFLARSHWGGVYNGEMKRLMLEHAFKFVNNVVFVIGTQNFRSQKAVEKLGAVRVGSTVDSGGADCFVYRITAA
jgi:N-acetyltransferase